MVANITIKVLALQCHWCMQIVSFTTSSMVQLACCSTPVPSQWMVWSSLHVCLVITIPKDVDSRVCSSKKSFATTVETRIPTTRISQVLN